MARVNLKTPAEIDKMREAGRVVGRALHWLREAVVPGVTTAELNVGVDALLRAAGGVPTFLGYPGAHPKAGPFPASICASVNEEVVHGIPGPRALKEGDILSVDVGVHLDGWCGDAAKTFAVGRVSRRVQKLLETTEVALMKGIAAMAVGGWVSDISRAVELEARTNGFSVVRQFVGHGVGRAMHEAPQVPNFVDGKGHPRDDARLEPGLALAIEPMLNIGGPEVLVDRHNGWVVFTKDRSWSAHFEHSVAMTDRGPVILTVP